MHVPGHERNEDILKLQGWHLYFGIKTIVIG